jgi:methionine-rich copper-binding protein CopC
MTIGTLAVLVISLLATSANAHPKLKSASPATDVSSKVSPTEIKLNFSEGVIAKFSGVEIKNESGKTIPTGVPVTDPKDQKQLVVPLPAPLTAGHYTVTWHAVSEDIRAADVASDDQAAPTHPATCETSLADSTEG